MTKSYEAKKDKVEQKEGEKWTISFRSTEFTEANTKREKILLNGAVDCKVQRMASGIFVVKTRKKV